MTSVFDDTRALAGNAKASMPEPSLIVLHPRHYRHLQAMRVYPGIFAQMIKTAWRTIKSAFPASWGRRKAQREYVRRVGAEAWAQAQGQVENEWRMAL